VIHVSSENPFTAAHTYNQGALNDRIESPRQALKVARTQMGPAAQWHDLTPSGADAIDGRTCATLLSQGCTLALLSDGYPRCGMYVWDEEAVYDAANDFEEEGTAPL
jgi:hypothetical protein